MSCGRINLNCRKCRLSESRTRVVPGTGSCHSKIVFIGEAPGRDEDAKGEPFVGRAGKILDSALEKAGTGRPRVYISNVVKCRPPSNRRPKRNEIDTCRGYLESELAEIRPAVICVLGLTAAKALFDKRGRMSELIGSSFEARIAGCVVNVFVSYHPAACLYRRDKLKDFEKAIEKAVSAV
jgi:DNA polymerase